MNEMNEEKKTCLIIPKVPVLALLLLVDLLLLVTLEKSLDLSMSHYPQL